MTASIQIHNVGDIVQTFEIFALDIRQQDEQGQIAFVDKPLSGTAFTLASFVQIDENLVTLAPQEQKEIFFQIRNSVDLSPGGHYGAVIARIQNQTETPSEQKILPALSSLLLIHKEGGEQYQLSLAPLDLSKNTLSLSLPSELRLLFSNQGNSHVVPRGVISVTDMFGRLVYKGIINESSLFVLPQSKREVKVKIQPVAYTFPLSFLSIKVEGSSDPGQSHYYQSFSLILIKPKIFMILLLLLVLLLYGAKRIRKSREKSFKKLL